MKNNLPVMLHKPYRDFIDSLIEEVINDNCKVLSFKVRFWKLKKWKEVEKLAGAQNQIRAIKDKLINFDFYTADLTDSIKKEFEELKKTYKQFYDIKQKEITRLNALLKENTLI